MFFGVAVSLSNFNKLTKKNNSFCPSVALPVCGAHIFLIQNKGNTQYHYHFVSVWKNIFIYRKTVFADIKEHSNNYILGMYNYPPVGTAVAIFMTMSSIIAIPIYFIYLYIQTRRRTSSIMEVFHFFNFLIKNFNFFIFRLCARWVNQYFQLTTNIWFRQNLKNARSNFLVLNLVV